MRVGLLGLQGAFSDHRAPLQGLGASVVIVRDVVGLESIERLILPGGESTVMAKFLLEFGLLRPLRERIAAGMPVWGVCAGAILLAATVDGFPETIGALPINVIRNAYGRQRASDQFPIDVPLLGLHAYPAVFIRAPRIDRLDPSVAIHATRADDPVFVQSGRVMATTFHPELNHDPAPFHRYFLGL